MKNNFRIKDLPSQYADAPPQAVRCALMDASPPKGQWPKTAINRMVELIDE